MKSQPSNELKSAISEGLIWAEGTTSKLTYMTLQFLIVKASPLGHHCMVFPTEAIQSFKMHLPQAP